MRIQAWLWGTICFAQIGSASPSLEEAHARHHAAESRATPWYASLAKGGPKAPNDGPRLDWPFELESIGHNIASYQSYGGSPYFHHGLDIRGEAGTTVRSPVGGKVINIENYVRGDPAYWEIAIQDDEGYIWQFHHVDNRSIPSALRAAYRSGARIEPGTVIGEIYYWSVTTFGERFHHVHLNILGEGSRYLNPFQFLAPLADDNAPEIVSIGLLQNGRRASGTRIRGNYSLYVEARDLTLHDKFYVPPYDIEVSIDNGEPITVWRFDSLPGGSSIYDSVNRFYVPSMTCGNYSCRKITIDLGFNTEGRAVFPKERGAHSVTVNVKDFEGHQAAQTFDYQVD